MEVPANTEWLQSVWTTWTSFKLFRISPNAYKWKKLSIRLHNLHKLLMCWCHKYHKIRLQLWNIIVWNQMFHPVWVCNLMTISETHPRHTSQHSNDLLRLCSYSCWKYLELSIVHMPLFLFYDTHTHTHTTFMPCDLARHYANGQTCHLPEISETKWESEIERERDSAHLSVCERSSVSTVHTQGTWDVTAKGICNVACCGGRRFWEKERHVVFEILCGIVLRNMPCLLFIV